MEFGVVTLQFYPSRYKCSALCSDDRGGFRGIIRLVKPFSNERVMFDIHLWAVWTLTIMYTHVSLNLSVFVELVGLLK